MQWIFFVLVVVPFVAWMVFGVGGLTGLGPDRSNVVLKVNGDEVHTPEFEQRVTIAREQYRQQYGAAPQTREEDEQIRDQVVNEVVQEKLLEQEYNRLGIRVSDEEVIAMASNSPLPEVMNDPQFQTDSQFDLRKWQQFLSTTTDRNLLLQIETRYREQIPRIKLAQYLTSDVYASDAKLWQIYKDQHDSVQIASLAVSPYRIPDTSAISDAAVAAYLKQHADDFKRPATAYVRFVAVPRLPNAADSAAARERAARVRAELGRGAKFDDVARRESSDSGSGQRGGEVGWIKKSDTLFVKPFMDAVRALKPGQLSAPVFSRFGYHIIRIDQAKGDSVKVRHILIPVAVQGEHLDQVEARADSLERFTAERSDPGVLDTAARRLGLQLSPQYQVVEDRPFRLGGYDIPDVSVWAFETRIGETSPVIEAGSGYYVFQLDSVSTGGVPPLAQVRSQVSAILRLEKQKALARRQADSIAAALRGVPNLTAAATARGLQVERFGPFTRLRPPSYVAREPVIVGTAFALRVGERSGVLEGENGYYIIESLSRKAADSSAWLKQRDVQRLQLRQALQQNRIAQYMEGVRAKAKIVDRRKDLRRAQATADTTAGF
jgi:peptidyl-prolyl cis-trans isomerase D